MPNRSTKEISTAAITVPASITSKPAWYLRSQWARLPE
jgi:hypothetical protein